VTTQATTPAPAQTQTDVERQRTPGVGDVFRGYIEKVRAGDVGSLPVIVGLIAIVAFFYSKNPNYVSPENFNNLIVQMAGVTTIAIGVVFVLLLGEIDLSIGYVSGIGGVIVAELQYPDHRFDITGSSVTSHMGIVAIILAVLAGAAIGAFQGSFVAFIGVPSFVVTLAGLLAWQGVIIKALGITGVIGIQNNFINDTANYYFSHTAGWIFAVVVSVGYAAATLIAVLARRRHGIRSDNLAIVAIKIVALTAIIFWVVWKSNGDANRGLPFAAVLMAALLIIFTFIAKRTIFGRHVYAVGGNAEAARRAGINVTRIRLIVFMISSAMAALGGVIFAARLSSVDLNAGGGTILLDAIAAAVIGGTSLFGGRGEVKSALLGALIIATIENGIDLVGYSASTKFIVTGAILLAAVTLDTISRRRLARSGR
jgi:D-xylose transport system permease protein